MSSIRDKLDELDSMAEAPEASPTPTSTPAGEELANSADLSVPPDYRPKSLPPWYPQIFDGFIDYLRAARDAEDSKGALDFVIQLGDFADYYRRSYDPKAIDDYASIFLPDVLKVVHFKKYATVIQEHFDTYRKTSYGRSGGNGGGRPSKSKVKT